MVRRDRWILPEDTEETLALDPDIWRPEEVDLLCAGFPCPPWSTAGKRRGEDDERNLWPEVYRSICYLRPRYVFLENVRGLLTFDYFGTILGQLAEAGYDAEWGVFSAAEVGATHKRERLFILAYDRCQSEQLCREGVWAQFEADSQHMAYAPGSGPTEQECQHQEMGRVQLPDQHGGEEVGYPSLWRSQRGDGGTNQNANQFLPWPPGPSDTDAWGYVLERWPFLAPALAVPSKGKVRQVGIAPRFSNTSRYKIEPDVRGMVDGTPHRLDRVPRLKALGNAVVPQTAMLAFKTLWKRMYRH